MYIYAVGNTHFHFYKIGISTSPERRILSLQYNVPFKFSFVGIWQHRTPSEIEIKAHRHFRTKREFGEWFKIQRCEEIEEFIGSLATKVDSSIITKRINDVRGRILVSRAKEELASKMHPESYKVYYDSVHND